jgi:hypothetical protein
VLAAGILVGGGSCGGQTNPAATSAVQQAPRPVQRPQAPPPGPPPDDDGLPPQVPVRATAGARAGDVRVIEEWLAAQRQGDLRRASRVWRLPSLFQDGTPVITVSQTPQRLAVMASFRCGAALETAGAAGAYVVASLRLMPRPGARCGAAAGHVTRAAIRVGNGQISEYYRLPADPRREPRRLAPHPAPGGSPFSPSA